MFVNQMKAAAKSNTLVMTSQEVAANRLERVKGAMMGTDFRCHSGARSHVHRNRKKEAVGKKFRWTGRVDY